MAFREPRMKTQSCTETDYTTQHATGPTRTPEHRHGYSPDADTDLVAVLTDGAPVTVAGAGPCARAAGGAHVAELTQPGPPEEAWQSL